MRSAFFGEPLVGLGGMDREIADPAYIEAASEFYGGGEIDRRNARFKRDGIEDGK